MRAFPRYILLLSVATLSVPRAARAMDPEESVDPPPDEDDLIALEKRKKARAEAAGGSTEEAKGPTDELANPGYIPGYRPMLGLGMAPSAPRYGTTPGGHTTPYGAPEESQDFEFKFSGYASAGLRLSTNERENPTADQSGLVIHSPPAIVDFYGAFNGTNSTQGSWVDLHFQYGNSVVQSHVTLTTWKPQIGSSWIDVRSQNLIDQAFVNVAIPELGDISGTIKVGAFRSIYGGLGQYSVGQYNTELVGMPFGIGEQLSLSYDINEEYTLNFEHGFLGRQGKVPAGMGPTPFDSSMTSTEPSSWVHHAHVGLFRSGDIPLAFNLHYLNNWSQDERDQVDDPQTYFIDETKRPDGQLSIFGADFRMIDNHLGNFAVAASYADAQNIQNLTGLSYFGAMTGEQLTKRYLGQQGGGNGKMLVAGVEYNLSWAKLLYHPDPFWGEGPDLITSFFATGGHIESKDPTANGRDMIKFGSEVTYRFASWIGLSGRYDHVIPNSKDSRETFDVISPKLLIKSAWITNEQITLSYTRWFYGPRTHTEFPFELPRDELDEQMFALHFGMWW